MRIGFLLRREGKLGHSDAPPRASARDFGYLNATEDAAMYFALLYETVPDHAERRTPYRAEHLALARSWHEDGRLLLAGAFDPIEGALLVFRTSSREEVEQFVNADPYVRNGLVPRWTIRAWTVVIGGDSAPP
jgi:uncharacterized protein